MIRNINIDLDIIASLAAYGVALNNLARVVNVVDNLVLSISRVVNGYVVELSVNSWVINDGNCCLTRCVAGNCWSVNLD